MLLELESKNTMLRDLFYYCCSADRKTIGCLWYKCAFILLLKDWSDMSGGLDQIQTASLGWSSFQPTAALKNCE